MEWNRWLLFVLAQSALATVVTDDGYHKSLSADEQAEIDAELIPREHTRTCACPAVKPTKTYVEKCGRGKADTTPFDKDGKFVSDCAPDTLYSWMSEKKLKLYTAQPFGSFQRARFFFRTPLGSFGYGERSVRIKLKNGTKFKMVGDGDRPTGCPTDGPLAKEYSNTVFVWQFKVITVSGYSEYLICSGDMIESWSTGTPEHLAEMEAERDWMATHSSDQFDKIEFGAEFKIGKSNRKSTLSVDSLKWTPEELARRLRGMRNQVALGQSQMGFAPGVKNSRERHFKSKVRNYWNCRCPLH